MTAAKTDLRALIARAKQQTTLRQSKMTGLAKYCPQTPTPKQQEFISSTEDEVLFGGAAGPGKSSALLMCALQYVEEPQFSALIVRRTFQDLSLPGSIMTRALEWLQHRDDVSWNSQNHRFTFPSGSTITFAYMDSDQDRFRVSGMEIQQLGVDELTQLSLVQWQFLQSRLRRNKGNTVRPVARAASNPGGRGHKWVKERWIQPETKLPDTRFIPALMGENPHLDQAEYLKSISRLDFTTQAQLRDGLWITDSTGKMFQYDPARNKIASLPALPEGTDWCYALGIDLGSSLSVPTTAFTVLCYHEYSPNVYIPMSFCVAGMTPTSVAEQVQELSCTFPFESIVCDAGGLGGGYINEMIIRWHIPVEPAQKTNKKSYRKLFNGALERGEILLVEGQCDALEQEFTDLQWNEDGTDNQKGQADHASDSACYAWRQCTNYNVTATPPPSPTDQHAIHTALQAQMRKEAIDKSLKRKSRKWYDR